MEPVQTAGLEWVDGFETGRVAGAIEGQAIVFDTLIDGVVTIALTGLAYLFVKGFSDYLTERWAADHDANRK